jgi:hypothetical protein
MAATSWLVGECDSTLGVNIKCYNTKLGETNKQYNNVCKAETSNSVQEIELDVEELCESRYMAVRPHVQEVMNDLIMKLTQEVKVLKTNSDKSIDA